MNDYKTNQVSNQEQLALASFYSRVYAILGAGIAISAVTAFLVINFFFHQIAAVLYSLPFGFLLLWIAQIGLVIYLGKKAFSNPTAAIGGFIAYSILNGVTISFTLAWYDIHTVGQAFLTAAVTFGAMALIGMFTKKDLSVMGRAMLTALIGVIIALVINIFLQSEGLDFFLSILTVLIFSGLTAYDNQMIRNYFYHAQGDQQTLSGIAVFCALQLYLDFINLLLAFIRIFGRD